MKGLYRFYIEWGRQGELEGQFIATQEEVDSMVGKDYFFDEPFGKHSQASGTLETEDVELVSNDPLVIAAMLTIYPSGYVSGDDIVNTIAEQN